MTRDGTLMMEQQRRSSQTLGRPIRSRVTSRRAEENSGLDHSRKEEEIPEEGKKKREEEEEKKKEKKQGRRWTF